MANSSRPGPGFGADLAGRARSMWCRRRAVAGFLIAWSLGAGPAAAQDSAGTVTFEQAQSAALAQAPALLARHAAAQAAQGAIPAAGQLPDPKLAVGIENFPISGPDRYSWRRESMTMRRLAWMQDVPNADKRAAQRGSADALGQRELALWRAEQASVRRETALAWLALYYAQRRLEVLPALEKENAVLQETLDARVASGRAMPVDVLLARQEALDLAERRDELQAQLAHAALALRRWTGDAVERTAGPPPALAIQPAGVMAGLDRHAELEAFEPMLAMARAEVDQARAARRGDWGWEVGYANRDRRWGDMVSVQLTFELPVSVATRQEPLVAARLKDVERLQAEQEDARRRVQADVQTQLAELQRLERGVRRQTEAAVPLAQERSRLALAGYESGRGDLASVLAARRDAVQAQLRLLELESLLMAQRARLTYLIVE
ncbi:MAG: TolC family protein [Aquabacterium sp.]|nr:MAG: TolC family protein [Aquabacterium sp.]TAL23272.1 MAG: TolC family protein [Aquabacterium sp.]